MHLGDMDSVLSKQFQADALYLWRHSEISLLDIRHTIISPREALMLYRLPTSAFLYTVGDQAKVSLDDTLYKAERFGIFHGGRGTEISIRSMEDYLEYYIIFYKAEEPATKVKEYLQLLGRNNPYRQQYGFTPDNPLYFAEQLRKMYERLKSPTPLNLLYGKTAFYQLVYEVYEEMGRGGIQVLELDVVGMAKRYLDRHSREAITIHEIGEIFGISHSHLHRLFKRQTGKSPQEYLMSVRLSTAKSYLRSSDVSVCKVAEYCGFQDERSFRRLFLKNVGITPGSYREKTPLHMRDITLENRTLFPHNEESQVSHGKLKTEGDTYMLKRVQSKTIFAAVVFAALLLTACSDVVTNTGSKEPTSVVSTQAVKAEKTEKAETRTVSTVMGDVEVPDHPQRVVVNNFIGDVLAFDVPLAAVDDNHPDLAYYDKVKNVKFFTSWDKESIMSLEPDLILDGFEDSYDKYSSIAPVVIIPWETTTAERITILGDVFGKPELAASLLADYNDKVLKVKKELGSKGILDKTISIFQDEDGKSMHTFGKNIGRCTELFYDGFQMKASPRIQKELIDKGLGDEDLSFEILPEYAGDIILHITDTSNDQNLNENPVWLAVPAVKAGNVVELPVHMARYNDILTQNTELDLLAEKLLALPIAQ